MPRRSVWTPDWLEKWMQQVRGGMIMNYGTDIDNTRAINIFLTLGIIRYSVGTLSQTNDPLTEMEKKAIEGFINGSTEDDEGQALMDELNTILIRQIEKGKAEVRAKQQPTK